MKISLGQKKGSAVALPTHMGLKLRATQLGKLSKGSSTPYYLQNFLGNSSLTSLVVVKVQGFD